MVKKPKSKKAVELKKIPSDDELEIVNLNEDGYSIREIAKNHSSKVNVPFKSKLNNVYLLVIRQS